MIEIEADTEVINTKNDGPGFMRRIISKTLIVYACLELPHARSTIEHGDIPGLVLDCAFIIPALVVGLKGLDKI